MALNALWPMRLIANMKLHSIYTYACDTAISENRTDAHNM